MPPTGSLEAFIAAARAGSLRKVSEDLNLSVSALSRRVQKLELHAGRALFSRGGNEYRLNDEGRRLFAEIERPLDEIASAFERRASPGRKGLIVGVPTSFATAWLIPRLDHFRKGNPDIDLRLDTSGSPIEKLGESLDMIIFFAEDGAERVAFEKLRPQGAFLVAREGIVDPLDGLKAALRSTPLLVHRHLPHILETWVAELKLPQDVEPTIDSFDDGPLLIAAAQSGLGMALVLEDMVNFYGNAAGLVRPFGEYVRTPFSYAIAAKPASGSVHAVDRFYSWIIEETRKESQARLP
ncbi:LysR substrate-binding domain-containing protein [Pelagerythrobacter aerophilus]|uniref:LysR family transcriptional regulator n=1 Tax=Pelagerythrobacter aerophilus TaxID=2306995 RepID=A0A418NDR6_9SPHN|nr:LysR family transcriptional regulator [Pelagerythrobacter aerophilus]RIV75394.1 LysR family transcriptional regulator [Pelagerythrobacter aerophilus]